MTTETSFPLIVLATANARFSHASLGLRSLKANLQEWTAACEVLECTIDDRPADVAERIAALNPRIVGLGVYIWNVALLSEVATILKQIRPDMVLVLGGPEVSCANDPPEMVSLADYVIVDEAEVLFYRLCTALLGNLRPNDKWIGAELPNLSQLHLPYDLYTDHDLAHRVIYVEASRGCPYGCEFCLSSLDKKVRRFRTDVFLEALDRLWQRGARKFKFVDRAIHLGITSDILHFFLQRSTEGLFLHFEMIPDHLPESLIAVLSQFPPGAVQLEAGVQTFDSDIGARISRSQNNDQTEQMLRRLLLETGVHIHADLVMGLPGDTAATIASSFDRLFATGVHEIQLGILKRLRGAPIARHSEQWQMVYRRQPPYDVLQTKDLAFFFLQRLKRFSRYFDLVWNSGHFPKTAPLLFAGLSPFAAFMAFSDWLFARARQTGGIALLTLAEYIFDYLTSQHRLPHALVADALSADVDIPGRRRLPNVIAQYATVTPDAALVSPASGSESLPARQRRRLR